MKKFLSIGALALSLLFSITTTFAVDAVPKFRPNLTQYLLGKIQMAQNKPITIDVAITLPPGYELNKEAPSDYVVTSPSLGIDRADRVPGEKFSINIDPGAEAKSGEIQIETTLYFCRKEHASVCEMKSYRYRGDIELAEIEPTPISISILIEPGIKIATSTPLEFASRQFPPYELRHPSQG